MFKKKEDPVIHDFIAVQQRGLDVYVKKNHDYGNAFEQSLDEDGLLVAKIRLNDKIRRFNALLSSAAMVDEAIDDTLLDLANYAIMTIAWLDKKKRKRKCCLT